MGIEHFDHNSFDRFDQKNLDLIYGKNAINNKYVTGVWRTFSSRIREQSQLDDMNSIVRKEALKLPKEMTFYEKYQKR